MAMNQGVDAQVQSRVDAYRNNPQQLMQMYQQNQELVDLLALQKLKSEKEAAARQMQMQMQQQPGTIAQQREQEVLQLTKNELAQQTQGVLQRKQQQQQANLQRAAQGGIGALAQQRPTPAPAPQGQPMPRMAGGGIVAFKPGGSVEGDARGARVLERLAEYGITSQDDWQRLDPEVRDRITRAVNAAGGAAVTGAGAGLVAAEINDLLADPFKAIGNLGVAASNTGLGMAMGLSDPRRPNEPFQYNANRQRMLEAARENMGSVEDAVSSLPAGPTQDLPEDLDPGAPMRAPGARDLPTMAGIGALPTGPEVPRGPGLPAVTPPPAPATEAEATATSTQPAVDTSATRSGIASLGGGSMGGAEAALMRGVQIGEDVLGRGEKAARFAEMEAQLAALDEELFDPEAERRQQLQAFLIGTAGATNIGYAMAGGAAAAINLENRQKQNRRDRMLSRIQLGERGMTMDTEIGRQALALGNQMFADFNANVRAAVQASATLDSAQLRAATADADREFNREKEANDQEYRMRDLEIREAANAAEAARNEQLDIDRRAQAVLTATNDMLRLSTQVHERAAEIYDVQAATAALTLTNPRDPDYPALLEARNTAVAEADAWAAQYLERHGVNDVLTDLQQQYYTLRGVSGMPGINPDDILEIETEGE